MKKIAGWYRTLFLPDFIGDTIGPKVLKVLYCRI